jgi:hypothetical protein
MQIPTPPPPGIGWGFATEGVQKTLPGGQIFWQITYYKYTEHVINETQSIQKHHPWGRA